MTKTKAKVKAPEPSEDELFLKRAHELKEKGNAHFARREHVQALASYAQALRLAPEGHADRALFHSNRAACYLRDNQFNEVIHECNEALKVSPKFAKALLRRSRAYELKGDLQKALTDVRSLTSDPELAGNNLTEAQEMSTRLEASLKNTTKKQRAKARAMMVQNSQAQAAAAAPQARKPVQPLTLKVTLGSDTRMVQVPGMLPLNDLVTMIRRKFPEETGNLQLKYRDRDNQLITVTNRQDLLAAVASSVAAAAQAAAASKANPAGLGGAGLGKGLPPQGPPAVALELVRAENETEEVVEFDDWLLDFAELFREHLGIDADGHVDLHNIGLDKCNQALEAAVSNEKAAPLFEQAAAKFQEVAALALLNWGNVHMCQARRLFDTGAEDKDKPVTITPEARAKAEEHYFEAETKYQKALELKADFYEAVIASGQQLFERAKLLSTAEGKAKDDKKVEELFEAAQAKLQEALVLIPENAAVEGEPAAAEKKKEEPKKEEAAKDAAAKPEEKKEEDAAAGGTDEVLVRSQVLVMWGNVLYEQSQVRAQQGKAWEALLDTAVAKFREAKCSEEDISGALASHAGKKAQEPAKEEKKAAEPAKKEEPKKDAAPTLPPKKEKKPKSGKK